MHPPDARNLAEGARLRQRLPDPPFKVLRELGTWCLPGRRASALVHPRGYAFTIGGGLEIAVADAASVGGRGRP